MGFSVYNEDLNDKTHLEEVVRDDSGSDDHNDLPEEEDEGSDGVNGSYPQGVGGLRLHKKINIFLVCLSLT